MKRDDLAQAIEQQIPRLRRYARALVRDHDEADDLVQECLDQAWRGVHQWHPAQDLRVWLFSIIHNLNSSRVRGFRPSNNDPTAAYRRPGTTERDSATDLGTIENGLAQLAEGHHEVLLLVCVEEMNYEQVATVLGVPVGTVTSRLHAAREHLRHWMNGAQRPTLRRVK